MAPFESVLIHKCLIPLSRSLCTFANSAQTCGATAPSARSLHQEQLTSAAHVAARRHQRLSPKKKQKKSKKPPWETGRKPTQRL